MESNKARLFAALCAFLIVCSFVCSSDSASCCTRYTKKKLPCLLVKNYSIQTIHGSCDINAIIFHVNGRFVCADPTKAWTKRAVTCVDERRKKRVNEVLMGKPSIDDKTQ
ncbi:C-C motif chemokine 20-like [Poecilia latipinna]|uniref:C-C motif chemokine 20b n=1 Tax=Poecilia formosa TaxID=48698 RepID=UPI000443DFF0|nr:PREDICTED: C-C motif chemokine 20-like [Poecilia formosa]XP_014895444.1 PREDICTED: C-C motif chemokine 20-like [Poecilia latipinna]